MSIHAHCMHACTHVVGSAADPSSHTGTLLQAACSPVYASFVLVSISVVSHVLSLEDSRRQLNRWHPRPTSARSCTASLCLFLFVDLPCDAHPSFWPQIRSPPVRLRKLHRAEKQQRHLLIFKPSLHKPDRNRPRALRTATLPYRSIENPVCIFAVGAAFDLVGKFQPEVYMSSCSA